MLNLHVDREFVQEVGWLRSLLADIENEEVWKDQVDPNAWFEALMNCKNLLRKLQDLENLDVVVMDKKP